MSHQTSEMRFTSARHKLSNSLKELEKTVIGKLQEISLNNQIIDATEISEHSLRTTTIDQAATIEKLHNELNNLQKTLADAGKESEFFIEKHKILADKFSQFRAQSLSLLDAVEADLLRISEIIKIEE